MIMVSDGIGLVQPSAVPSSVVAAYTNDVYLRDAYRCLQMSHRDLRKPSYSDSGHLALRRYKDVYTSPSR
jgi:hypothetical protein